MKQHQALIVAESSGDSGGCLLHILALGQAVCLGGCAYKDCDPPRFMVVRVCFAA